MSIQIIGIRDNPEYLERGIDYFASKWGIDRRIYADSISHSITTGNPLSRWYLMLKDDEIIGSYGLISPFHYCRAFQMLTGISVMDYMRKRRLSKAAIDLLDTGKSISQVAFDWGFNSHENFVRAFSKEYGISPSAYRKSRYTLAYFNRIDLKHEDLSKICHGIKIEPKLVCKDSFIVVGPSIKTTWYEGKHNKDIPIFWNRYYAEKAWAKIPGRVEEETRTDYGIGFNYDVSEERFDWKGTFDWLGGVRVNSVENLPEGMSSKLIPQCEYAVFKNPASDKENFIENLKLTKSF